MHKIKETLLAVIGSLVFAAGINLFIVPVGMYSGGFLGISQLIRTLVEATFNFHLEGFDLAGIILYLFDIPLFFLAYRGVGRYFFVKTVVVVSIQSFS